MDYQVINNESTENEAEKQIKIIRKVERGDYL